MVFRPIRQLGDPGLKLAFRPVRTFGPGLRSLVDDLMETVDAPGRAGLAVPQIGVGLRVFSYLVDNQHGYVINPEVVELSNEPQDGPEGCLSVPELSYPVRRAARVVLRGVDIRERSVVVGGAGLLARCLQHELDHLNGLLYLDRLEPEHRKQAMRAIREADWFRESRAPRGGWRPGTGSQAGTP